MFDYHIFTCILYCKSHGSGLYLLYSLIYLDKIIHPVETTKEVGHGIKELAVAGAGVNAYGNNVDGFTTEKHVTAVTNAATDIADAGMGVNSYGTNVDMK